MANEELRDEAEALNAIYGADTLTATAESSVYILRLPQQSISLRVSFPDDYPAAPPSVLGTETSGEQRRKGEGASVVRIFRDLLGNLYQPGDVCLFNVIEEITNKLNGASEAADHGTKIGQIDTEPSEPRHGTDSEVSNFAEQRLVGAEPAWVVSDVVTELKSVFVARCAPVSSPEQAKLYLQHFLDSDKKIRSATHNITAWRIMGKNGVSYQDCDDDGETAAGGRVLHLMQLMGIWDCMVVVTRWYGGHQLGPKRFSIISTVARNAFVKANFVPEEHSTTKKQGGLR